MSMDYGYNDGDSVSVTGILDLESYDNSTAGYTSSEDFSSTAGFNGPDSSDGFWDFYVETTMVGNKCSQLLCCSENDALSFSMVSSYVYMCSPKT